MAPGGITPERGGHPVTPEVRSYLVAALWSSTDDDGEPLDRKYSPEDFAPESLAQAAADVA